jgi:hypothetical protein
MGLDFRKCKKWKLRLGTNITSTSNPGKFSFPAVFGKYSTYPFVSCLPPATICWQKTNQPIIFIASSFLIKKFFSVKSLYLFERCNRNILYTIGWLYRIEKPGWNDDT